MYARRYSQTIIRLTQEERKKYIDPLLLKGWCIESQRDAINKKFQFKTFIEAWGFMTKVALQSEKMSHHPEYSFFSSYLIFLKDGLMSTALSILHFRPTIVMDYL